MNKKLALWQKNTDILIEEEGLFEVTLICPITRKRIESPSRGKYCKHLECFDLKAYLTLNQKSTIWNCPICNKKSELKSLYVDSYFVNILNEYTKSDLVEFKSQANWSVSNKLENDSIKNTEIELIELI